MAVLDLFSKRIKRESGDTPDVYSYDQIPQQLRVQTIHIWRDAIGNPEEISKINYQVISSSYETIAAALRREYGVFRLSGRPGDSAIRELEGFLVSEEDILKVLDVIELSFRYIDRATRAGGYLQRYERAGEIADDAISELNARFKEHGIGYFYSDGIIIRVDSELIHKEAVIPALVVLRNRQYQSAEQEFLSAHEHYRTGKNAQALVDCYKAFESVMKIICTKRSWQFDKTKAAAHLVDVCLSNGLIATFWQNHFTGLRQILESAIPTPRNKIAGHGAGAVTPVEPSAELTAYVLHMTAATILFLTEAEANLP
ncbi:hypothetical protein IYX23_17830 [Methylocystis sp. L43]|uniref:STM4504/CBY_0614 family protein n=1 Tax=unclassified Methylocystis TaxID=2625913 RepID=UPI0018C23670|nr:MULTISPECIES: hypothetical protein [unclassified Methylocystis]MBG0799531.1 hypothetical protein [Methylocystis sp. L43]MBG0807314.1 hypothetical protein [Methylocystis sp. H15]